MKNPTRNMNYPIGQSLNPNYHLVNQHLPNLNVQPLAHVVTNEHASIKNSRNIAEIKQSMDSLQNKIYIPPQNVINQSSYRTFHSPQYKSTAQIQQSRCLVQQKPFFPANRGMQTEHFVPAKIYLPRQNNHTQPMTAVHRYHYVPNIGGTNPMHLQTSNVNQVYSNLKESQKNHNGQNIQYNYEIDNGQIYCAICSQSYPFTEQQQHIEKHKKRVQVEEIQPLKEVLNQFLQQNGKQTKDMKNQKFQIKPIVQPEQFNVQYAGRQYTLEQNIKYKSKPEQQVEQYVQYGVGNDQSLLISKKQSSQYKITVNPEPEIYEDNVYSDTKNLKTGQIHTIAEKEDEQSEPQGHQSNRQFNQTNKISNKSGQDSYYNRVPIWKSNISQKSQNSNLNKQASNMSQPKSNGQNSVFEPKAFEPSEIEVSAMEINPNPFLKSTMKRKLRQEPQIYNATSSLPQKSQNFSFSKIPRSEISQRQFRDTLEENAYLPKSPSIKKQFSEQYQTGNISLHRQQSQPNHFEDSRKIGTSSLKDQPELVRYGSNNQNYNNTQQINPLPLTNRTGQSFKSKNNASVSPTYSKKMKEVQNFSEKKESIISEKSNKISAFQSPKIQRPMHQQSIKQNTLSQFKNQPSVISESKSPVRKQQIVASQSKIQAQLRQKSQQQWNIQQQMRKQSQQSWKKDSIKQDSAILKNQLPLESPKDQKEDNKKLFQNFAAPKEKVIKKKKISSNLLTFLK